MTILHIIWRDLTTPEDFRGDWYGWMTNKLSHVVLGFGLALVTSAIWLTENGEFPHKQWLWPGIAFAVAVFQIGAQGWNGWDTIEDWWFISVFGAGGTIVTFTQIDPDYGLLGVSVWSGLTVMTLIGVWLVMGIIYRLLEIEDGGG